MPSQMFIRKGHVLVYRPNHPHVTKWGYIQRARSAKEEEAGHILPKKSIFHHINGDSLDDDPKNIMVFDNSASHTNYHREERALNACGKKYWRKCIFCKKYGDPKSKEWHQLSNGNAYHRFCKSDYDRRRYANRANHDSPGAVVCMR